MHRTELILMILSAKTAVVSGALKTVENVFVTLYTATKW